MGKARFPYGRALGYRNPWVFCAKGTGAGMAAAGTANNISGTATPNLSNGDLFYTNNTAALTITAFTHQIQGGVEGCEEGRLATILFLDTNTTVQRSSYLVLSGTGNFGGTPGANNVLELMYSRSAWYELTRKPNTTQDVVSVNMGGTTNTSVNAADAQMIIVTGTAAALTVNAISGGYIGQNLRIALALSGGVTYTINTNGNLVLAGTAAWAIGSGGNVLEFSKVAANSWYLHDRKAL